MLNRRLVQELLEEKFLYFTPPVMEAIDEACSQQVDLRSTQATEMVRSAIKRDDDLGLWRDVEYDHQALADCIAAAMAYEEELVSLSETALRARYKVTMAKRRQLMAKRGENLDRSAFYAHPEHDADFDEWNGKARWTIAEAASLSLGKNPLTVNAESLSEVGATRLKTEYLRRVDLLRRFFDAQPDLMKPTAEFVDYFQKHGIEAPIQFTGVPSNLPAFQSEEVPKLKQQIKQLKARIDDMLMEPEQFDKRNKMSMLIFAMAKVKFGYKGATDGAITSIFDCIEVVRAEVNVNISMVKTTISTHLAKAEERARGA